MRLVFTVCLILTLMTIMGMGIIQLAQWLVEFNEIIKASF